MARTARQYNQTISSTAAWNLELAKGLEPPTL
jgi:hypothetical protein